MQYQIVEAVYIKDLIEKVNMLTAQGWEPQGGVVAGYGTKFLQAMIKEEENE